MQSPTRELLGLFLWNGFCKQFIRISGFRNRISDDLDSLMRCYGLAEANETIWNAEFEDYKLNLSLKKIVGWKYLTCTQNVTFLEKFFKTIIENPEISKERVLYAFTNLLVENVNGGKFMIAFLEQEKDLVLE